MHPVWAYCGLDLLWDRDRLQPIGGNLEHIGAGRSAGLAWKLEQFIQFAPVVRINPPERRAVFHRHACCLVHHLSHHSTGFHHPDASERLVSDEMQRPAMNRFSTSLE